MIIFASQSETKCALLKNANIAFQSEDAKLDEETIRLSLASEGATPREIADYLAQAKALKISRKYPNVFVLGSDQVLEFENQAFGKTHSKEELNKQLFLMRQKKHKLLSAAVIAKNGETIWRTIGEAQIFLRDFSQEFLDEYLNKNYENVKNCVGGYQFENDGIHLFGDFKGSYFDILGLPLLPILNQLRELGVLGK